MTTEHQDDQRRGGGFREAVNELFGRNERDSRGDTSQLDALDRDEARRHGDDVNADPAARHAYGDQAAVGQPGDARLDDPAAQTTPGSHYDADGRGAPGTAAHGDPLADDVAGRGRHDDGVVDDRSVDPRAQYGQNLTQEQHLGEAQPPQGGEVRGDTVTPEHVRGGGDPTAQGQVQHGGELRGDPDGVRSDADLASGTGVRDAGTADVGARDAGTAGVGTRDEGTAGVGAGAAAAGAAHTGTAHQGSVASNGHADGHEERAALVTQERAESYSVRWDSVKGEFVDEPRRAVANADALVGELLDELQELFKQQRTQIEQGLAHDETSTEDLRVALRRYRSFFDRLLSI